jgi:hypothetical protein
MVHISKPMKKILILFFVASLALSCEYESIDAQQEGAEKELNHAISGTWLYVEYGYSPGGGYYIVPVPPDPPQTITFNGDFTMSSTQMEFEMYKYYRLLEDTDVDRPVIAFFKEDPGNEPLELAGLSPTWYIFWNGDDLNLNYRWCIEGCHMKFRRLSPVENE